MTARQVLAVPALAAVYLLTLASTDPVDAVTGLLLAAVLVAALRNRLRPPPGRSGPSLAARVAAFPVLTAVVLADVVYGTWDVALRVLRLRPLRHPGIVLVPIGDRSAQGVAVTGLIAGLSPGTLLVDVDAERRLMLFHVIDASDPDAVRAQLEAMYRHQRRVFP